MKKKLLKLDPDIFNKICSDFSIEGQDKNERIAKLIDYLKSYSLRWQDLASRYQL